MCSNNRRIKLMKTGNYDDDYSEESLWRKITKFAVKAGEGVIEKALTLYETMKDEDTPVWAKATIISALGYFISPVDAIPDIIPVVGFSDDLGMLAGACVAVAANVKDEHIRKARETLRKWFGGLDYGV